MKIKSYWAVSLITLVATSVSGGALRAEFTNKLLQVSDQDKLEIASLKRDISVIDSTLSSEMVNIKRLLAKYKATNQKMDDIDLRLLKMESMMLTGAGSIRLIRTIPLSPEEYMTEYKTALESFESYEYNRALLIFQRLILSNPDNELADNSQYWLGECYHGIKDYERSILEFEKVFTFPNNNKMDAAQLKLGICYLRLGNKKGAMEEFSRLSILYPDSEYIPTVNSLMNKIQ